MQVFFLSQFPEKAAETQIREVNLLPPTKKKKKKKAQSRISGPSSSLGRQRIYLTMLLKGSGHLKHIYRKGNVVRGCSTP